MTTEIVTTIPASTQLGCANRWSWTYHHVVPVRTYFLAASTLLQALLRPGCPAALRVVGREALSTMPQYGAGRNRIARMVDGTGPAGAAEIATVAKECDSPPWGGLPGPEPSCRADDPGEGAESLKPASAPAAWWADVRAVGEELRAQLGRDTPVRGGETVRRTLDDAGWDAAALAIAKSILAAAGAAPGGALRFEPSDWRPAASGDWAILAAARIEAPDRPVTMRLRRPGEADGFRGSFARPDSPPPPSAAPGRVFAARRGRRFLRAAP